MTPITQANAPGEAPIETTVGTQQIQALLREDIEAGIRFLHLI